MGNHTNEEDAAQIEAAKEVSQFMVNSMAKHNVCQNCFMIDLASTLVMNLLVQMVNETRGGDLRKANEADLAKLVSMIAIEAQIKLNLLALGDSAMQEMVPNYRQKQH